MKKEEINELLKLGPKDAQAIHSVDDNNVFCKKDFSGKVFLCIYNRTTRKQTGWFKLESRIELGFGQWLFTDTDSRKCLCNFTTGEQSVWFKEYCNIDKGMWLLTDFDGNKGLYSSITGIWSGWLKFETIKSIGLGQLLLIDFDSRKCFYDFITGKKSDWLELDFLSFEVEGKQIKCTSSPGTVAILDLETMQLGPFRMI